MEKGRAFVLKIGFSLVLALFISGVLTKFIFYPTLPIIRLSFRIWLAQKKRQIAALPKTFRKTPPLPPHQLPSPIFYSPPPTKTPSPKPSPPPPRITPIPTPTKPPTPSPTPLPSLTPTPSPKPSPPFNINQEAKEVVRLINEERAKRNLSSLDTPPLLMEAAQLYIEDLGPYLYQNKKCGHGVPDKGLIWDYAKRVGYRGTPVGEVAMCGARTAKETVNGWMNSSGHRSIIMDSRGKYIGVGIWPVPADSWGRKYWVAGVYY